MNKQQRLLKQIEAALLALAEQTRAMPEPQAKRLRRRLLNLHRLALLAQKPSKGSKT